MPDGDVTITVTLDTNDVKAKIDELTKDLQKMANSAKDNGMTKEFQAITKLLDTVSIRVDKIVAQLGNLNNTETNPEQFEQMQDALLGYAYQLGVAEARVRANGTVAEETGEKSSNAFNKASANVSKYSKKTNSALASIKRSASQAFSFKGISRGIRRLAQLAFGVYSVTALLNKLKSAIKEGINNLVQFQSDTNATNEAMTEFKTSLLFIQNAWGAAFAPIINVVQPILTSLMDTFAEVGNTIARFFGALTGQQQVIQALRVSTGDYAASLKKAGGAAKQLQDRLAGFDDLNVLGKDTGSGGGGGGVSGPDPSEMFEYVDVDSSEFAGILGFFDDIKKKIEESGLIEAFGNLWDAMQRFKDSEFVKTLEKIALWLAESTFTSTLSILTNALNLLADILNGDLDKGLEDLNKLLADLTFDPLITLAGVFDTIFGTDVAGWLEDVKKSIEEIDFTGLPGYDKLVTALDELKTAWDNFKDSVRGFWDMLEETGVLDVLKTAITEFVELGWDLVLQGIASALSLIADALTIISAILNGDFAGTMDAIKNTLADIDFQPLETVASIFDHIFNTDIAGWLEGVHEKIEALHFQDLVDAFEEGWERIKSSFWLGVGIIAALLGITDEKFQAFSSTIRTIMTGLKHFLNNTWENIKLYAITAMQVLSKILKEIWDGIKEHIETPVNSIIKAINIVINALESMINGVADALGVLSIDIPDWVPEWGGKSLRFDIGHVSLPNIPYLAQGAVIPPNKEFMAVLGDQSSGTNIEAPLDTIKQAVAEVVGNNGNEEVIALLQQLIAVVESKNLVIGDKDIGKANARYMQSQNLRRGTSF